MEEKEIAIDSEKSVSIEDISETEMFDTFNMGVGLVIVVNSDSAKFILNRFKQVKKIGEIKEYQIGVVIK